MPETDWNAPERSAGERKIQLMLAGPGSEMVIYQMSPVFTADARFNVSAMVPQWADLESRLQELKPELLIVQAEIAPGPEALLKPLGRMLAWGGVVIVILPPNQRELRGVYEKAENMRGVFFTPVNWGEVAQAGYAAAMTERARAAASGSLGMQRSSFAMARSTGGVTGTKVVALMSATGGAGASTLAEALAVDLQTRLNVRTLLMSFGLPPAVVSHLGLRYMPNAGEFFVRPGDGFQAALQKRDRLEALLAPEDSVEYARAASESDADRSAPGSIHSLVMASWSKSYAAVCLDLPTAENTWALQGLGAANTAVIVARPTFADIAATWHRLVLLLEKLSGAHRIPRESIFLAINQAGENSSFTAREFCDVLVERYGWSPPVAAVIPFDPAITRAQDRSTPPVATVEGLAKGVRSLQGMLFPGLDGAESRSSHNSRGNWLSKLPFKVG
jgi:cellulose biosynthesis protein BcsQ